MKVYMVTVKEKSLGLLSVRDVFLYKDKTLAEQVAEDYRDYYFTVEVEEKEIL